MFFRTSPIAATLNRQARRLSFPFRLKKRHYRLRPTRYGMIFLLMLAALLVGSINHNNNFGYLLTFLLGGIVLVSLAHSYVNLQDISITPVPAKPVFAGDSAEISLLLQAAKPGKRGIKGRLDRCFSEPADLVDGAPARITIPVPTHERGMLHRNSVSLATGFPLGLIELEAALPVFVSCLVYPAPVAGALITDPDSAAEGEGTAAGAAGDTDFSELSPYRLGDDIRRLHWKSLAAGKDLHTVKYEQSSAGGTMFSLSSVPGDHVETKLGRLCHMILSADSRAMQYGLALDDFVIAPSTGTAHRNICLKALALYR